MHTTRYLLLGLIVASLAHPAEAHPLAPSLLELRTTDDHRVEVTWKVSRLNPQAALLVPVLPSSCVRTSDTELEQQAVALVRRWSLKCPAGLSGSRLGVRGLEQTDTRVLLRVKTSDKRSVQVLLDAETTLLVVPPRTTGWQVFKSYLGLGFEHILGGWDHLLFVLGLLFLVSGRRQLFVTVTAFTLGHSVTLSLAALGLVKLPSAPIELAIALSIWFLAVELARGPQRRTGRPWLMAGFFGLLHGLGFAGALAEIGLPRGEIPLALLAFNTGIEAGQLAFIAVVLGLVALADRLPVFGEALALERRLALPASYLIGALAFHACLQRATDLWRIAA